MNLSSWLYICIKKFTKVPKNDWIYLCVSYEEYILPTILKNGPSLTLKSLWSLFEECTCKTSLQMSLYTFQLPCPTFEWTIAIYLAPTSFRKSGMHG